MSELFLSIDLGTTRLKAAAYRTDGTLAHLVIRRHVEQRHGSFRWQSAERWWSDAVGAVRELIDALPDSHFLGISLSGRGGAAVFANEDGAVIAEPWSDGRHRQEAQTLRQWRRDDVWLSNYGLQLISKYQWLRANEPETAGNIRYAFYAKDWLLYRLTGAHTTDWTSGPDAGSWDVSLGELGLPADLLPAPALPWTLAGTLTQEASRALGLPAGTPIAVGAHDGLAANIGAGALEDRTCAITLGTHAVVRMVMNEPPPDAYRFYGCPPGRHIIGGNAVLAGRSVDWFLELAGADADNITKADYQQFEAAALTVPAGADGVRFLPFLAGQVAPESRPGARAVFAGMGLAHSQAHLYRAVLEGAAFAIADIFDQVQGWCGQPTLVRATGGGSESRLWMDILASIIDQPIELSGAGVEGRGAAVCLAVALGRFTDPGSAARAMVRPEHTAQPDPTLLESYRRIRTDWQALNDVSRRFDAR
jgi:xylulokinase